MQTNAAEVVRVHDLTHDVHELDLRLISPAILDFQSGQFISFEIPVEGRPHPMTRAYSIASPPSQRSILTVVFNRVDHGPGSTLLFGLKPGDQVHFKGPAGSFRLRDDAPRNLLFVATGTGIAPIRSMLHTLLPKATPQVVSLLWGLRAQRDLYYEEELHELSARYPMFHGTITLSRPDPGWAGPTGRVTALVRERVKTVANLAVYLCGNGGMIKVVTDFLRSKGLCPIYREKWYDEENEEE
ncbi:MAG TPA: FAD-binding oxidoreductase [Nitrospira sp.]